MTILNSFADSLQIIKNDFILLSDPDSQENQNQENEEKDPETTKLRSALL